jgi:hypothetical protein
LANGDPQQGLLDVGGRLIITAQEPHRWCSLLIISRLADLREYGVNVGRLGDIGRVGLGAHEEEVISESIVAGRSGDALINGNFLCCRAIGNANINEARFKILDAVSGVARVPCYSKGLGATGDGILDVCVCEG